MRLILLVGLFCTLLLSAKAQCSDRYMEVLSDSFQLHKDIYFGENISENGELMTLLLDVYEPIENDGYLKPLVIMVHGGSFTGGNKTDGEVAWICEDLAKRGIVAASVNYRTESDPLSLLSEEKMVKAVVRAVEDIKASVRFFYKDISIDNSWSVDPEIIFLGGSSAGSISVLHTVFMDEFSVLKPKWKTWIKDLNVDTLELNGNSGNPGYADSVAGLINISGAIADLNFLNNNADIPILSIHNSIDLSVPYQFGYPYFIPTLPIVAGSRPIHFRMLDNGGQSSLLTFEGLNHVPHTEFITGEQLFPEYDKVVEKILRFLGEVIPCEELPTGITLNEIHHLQAFPNPVSIRSPFIQLTIPGIHSVDFEWIDITGKVIKKEIIEIDRQTRLPDSITDSGLYYLKGMDKVTRKYYLLKLMVTR